MSGANRTVINATDQARLGHDHVARIAHEHYRGRPTLGDLCLWHHGYAIPRRITWSTVAEECDVDFNTIWNVWFGKASEQELVRYEKGVAAFQAKCGKANKCSYAETSAATLIMEALDLAAYETKSGDTALVHIVGPSGIGKTHIVRAWAAANNHGRSVLYEPLGAGGISQVLRDIAVLNGVDSKLGFNKLVQRVANCFYAGRVLIVDEIQLLVKEKSVKQPIIDVLRRIADKRNCALVGIATDDKFEADLSTSSWNDIQYWRRQARIVELPEKATDDDIENLFKWRFPSLEFPENMLTVLAAVNAHEKGGFGQVARILRDAQLKAERERHKVTLKDVYVCVDDKTRSLDAVKRRFSSKK